MKKVLVTGGDGFIGSNLASRLLSLGVEVLVLDKSIYKPTYCDIHKATLIEGDILSHNLMFECLEQVDTCFHLAALSSLPACSRDWIFSHENNVVAFNGLLEELRRVSHPVKLIYASSCAVYGNSEALPLAESEHVQPSSTYGADKLSNELYARVIAETYRIPSIGLRLFNVYGKGQLELNPYSGVITLFSAALEANQPIRIFGDGHQTRDFIYIDDVIDALIIAGQTPADKSGVYNICRSQSISILDLAHLMMKLLKKDLPIIHEKERLGDLYHSRGDNSLAKKELGFTAKTAIEQGLAKMLAV